MAKRRYLVPGAEAPALPPATAPGESAGSPAFPWGPAPAASLLAAPPPLAPCYRFTCSTFPATQALATRAGLPLALMIAPTAPDAVPVVDCRSCANLIRCKSCAACLCPQAVCAPDGRSWDCPICRHRNAVDSEFLSTPLNLRPETQHFVYDALVPEGYSTKPALLVYLFALDLSYDAFRTGFTPQMIESVRACVGLLPEEARIGLIGASDRLLFYDLVRATVMVFADLADLAAPTVRPSSWPTVADARPAFLAALDSLLRAPPSNPRLGTCTGSVFHFAARVLARTGGLLFVNAAGRPREGPHALASRSGDDAALLRLPLDGSGRAYREAAMALASTCVSTHFFGAGPEFADLTCIAIPGGLSAGSCQYYATFDGAAQRRLHADVFRRLTDRYDVSATGRLRLPPALKVTRTFSNVVLSTDGTNLLGAVGRHVGLGYGLSVESDIGREEAVLQWVYLFTDPARGRVLRVFSFAVRVSADLNAVLASVDEGALAAVMARKAVIAVLHAGSAAALETVRKEVAAVLASGARFSVLPQFLHALLSHGILHARANSDWIMAQLIDIRSLNVVDSLLLLYPRMVCVDGGGVVVPLTAASFAVGNCFVVHLKDQVIVWIGAGIAQEWLEDAFGVTSLQDIQAELPVLTLEANMALNAAIQECWKISQRYLTVSIIPQGDPREVIFKEILVEDSTASGAVFTEWRKRVGGIFM